MAETRADPHCSDYYLHGVTNFNTSVKLFCVVCALVSWLCDAVLEELCQDDRVVRTIDVLEAAMAKSYAWLHGFSPYVWVRLAGLISDSYCWRELKGSVMHAAHVAWAYVKSKCFDMVHKRPWSFSLCDIPSNLIALKAEEAEPTDPTAGQLWHLLHMGYSQRLLHRTVGLLREVHWSTKMVEDQHGFLQWCIVFVLICQGQLLQLAFSST